MIRLSEIADRHKGQSAVILCGGPSMPDDFKRAPDSCCLFSVNTHGVRLAACEYAVFVDGWKVRRDVLEYDPDTTCICPTPDYTDILIEEPWQPGDSGMVAVWVAAHMGFGTIYIAGFEGYASGAYWWGDDPFKKQRRKAEDNVRRWQVGLEQNVLNCRQRVRALSGPLVDVFGGVDA